jgi:hypothetical protein
VGHLLRPTPEGRPRRVGGQTGAIARCRGAVRAGEEPPHTPVQPREERHDVGVGGRREAVEHRPRGRARARVELAEHLDGELTLTPLPSVGGDRRAEIRGRVKLNGLLEG